MKKTKGHICYLVILLDLKNIFKIRIKNSASIKMIWIRSKSIKNKRVPRNLASCVTISFRCSAHSLEIIILRISVFVNIKPLRFALRPERVLIMALREENTRYPRISGDIKGDSNSVLRDHLPKAFHTLAQNLFGSPCEPREFSSWLFVKKTPDIQGYRVFSWRRERDSNS